MLFNSFIFILLFLPLSVGGYFLMCRWDHRIAQSYLLVMSLIFYAFNYPPYLAIILVSIFTNFALSRLIIHAQAGERKKIIFVLGIIFNIGILGYYKYLDFTIWNINMLFKADIAMRNIVLPLGISFYTIQQVSYIIDAYRGEKVDYGFIDYALYVSFFPQLVAGPIVYHSELVPQIQDEQRRRINPENLMKGIIWFVRGLAKKVFLADRLGAGVTWGYESIADLTSADTWLVILAYTFQLYFDFSGYSDMACGIATMFNFELPQNFDSPYRSLSIADFWNRWHMTLARFLTKYIYIPLGGSRKGSRRTAINIMIVFLVSGIWHGANYTYILWGLINGVLVLGDRFWGGFTKKIYAPLRWAVTFFITVPLMGLFRSSGIKEWLLILRKCFMPDGEGISGELLGCFDAYLPLWLLLMLSFVICIFMGNNYRNRIKVNTFNVATSAVLLALCLFTLNRTSIFLYFNF